MMRYYPVFLDIVDKSCLVVGGGHVGTRKVLTLLDCGARVKVVSRDVTPELQSLADRQKVVLRLADYCTADLDGMFLVIGATDDEFLNRKIHFDAERQHKLCNIADRPEACNFILPSIINRGDLTIAISTAGQSPALAKKLRQDLQKDFGNEYAELLRIMGALRAKLLRQAHAPEEHKPLFEKLIHSDLLKAIKQQDRHRIDVLLRDIFGEGYRLDDLQP
jgi:precorrin-2 dehydrogenase / sirohydrochlorin ferrochelatase